MPFTPGPWHVIPEGDGDLRIAVGAGEAIAHITNMHSEDIANARLIAAAPDLLALLHECRDVLDISDPYRPELAKRIEVVIAKAEET